MGEVEVEATRDTEVEAVRKRTWIERYAVGDGIDYAEAIRIAKDYAERSHPGTRQTMITPLVNSHRTPSGQRDFIVTVVGRSL